MKTHEMKIKEQADARLKDIDARIRTKELRDCAGKAAEEQAAADEARMGRVCACGSRHRTADAYARHAWHGYGYGKATGAS